MFFRKKIIAEKYPDFLCIGMQKGGTAFLYNCLNGMTDFKLPALKEIHHFDVDGVDRPGPRRILRGTARQFGEVIKDDSTLVSFFQQLDADEWCAREWIDLTNRGFVADRTSLHFMRKLSLYVSGGGGDREYLSLFEPYQGFITGDVTPAYSTLEIAHIKKVKKLLPDTKIILCVRDPVARLWSQVNMVARRILKNRKGSGSDYDEAELLDEELSEVSIRSLVARQDIFQRSFPSRTYKNWLEIFGDDNLLVIHFDDLTQKTERVMERVAQFFDRAPDQHNSIPTNRKENKTKISLDAARLSILEECLGDEPTKFEMIFQHHRDRV